MDETDRLVVEEDVDREEGGGESEWDAFWEVEEAAVKLLDPFEDRDPFEIRDFSGHGSSRASCISADLFSLNLTN